MLKLIPILLVAVLAGTACSSDSNDPGTPNDTNSKNSFTMNGDGYSNASFVGFSFDTAAVAVESGGEAAITITGRVNNSEEIFSVNILLPSDSPGTYQFDPNGGASLFMVASSGSASKQYLSLPGSGSVTLASWNGTRATGTFECGVTNSGSNATVTGGKFDVLIID